MSRRLLSIVSIGLLVVISLWSLTATTWAAPLSTTRPTSSPLNSSSAPLVFAATEMIAYDGDAFSPATITVTQGTEVIWQNSTGVTVTLQGRPISLIYLPLVGKSAGSQTSKQTLPLKPGTSQYLDAFGGQLPANGQFSLTFFETGEFVYEVVGNESAWGRVVVQPFLTAGGPFTLTLPIQRSITETTIYTVSNPTIVEGASTSQFVDQNETVVLAFTDTMPINSSFTFDVSDIPDLDAGFNGDLVVVADIPLAGQAEVVALDPINNGNPTPTPTPIPTFTSLIRTSPHDGEDGVAVTRETILEFDRAIASSSVIQDAIRATFAGKALNYRHEIASDGQRVTLFYDEILPAGARVRIEVDGDQLRDFESEPVDVDGDGTPGGVVNVDFDTLGLTPVDGTEVCGRVFASELDPDDSAMSINTPLEGTTITVDGLEATLNTTTDSMGNFCLSPVPAGRFFVHIDGRTATVGVPPNSYYPFVGKTWTSIAGQSTNVGDVFLPLVADGTLQPVSADSETTIQFPAAVVNENPEFAGVSITIPADSLFSDNGSRGGMVGIAPVPPDRLPGTLPENLNFPVVITVQTDGATNFDIPAPVCFPNLPDPDGGERLQPGELSALWSFDHDTGRWDVVGQMTVNEDGSLICTNDGVGIRAPGWHGANSGSPGNGGGGGPGGGGPGGGGPNDCSNEGAALLSGVTQCGAAIELAAVQMAPGIGCAVGFAAAAAGTAVDCNISPGSCGMTAAINTVGALIGCVPGVGGPLSALWTCTLSAGPALADYFRCRSRSVDQYFEILEAKRPVIAPLQGNFIDDQRLLFSDTAAVYEAVLGDRKWTTFDATDWADADRFFTGVQDAMQPWGPGGRSITTAEADALMLLPLPLNISDADRRALFDRLGGMVDGQLGPSQFGATAISQAGTQLESRTADLQSKGWRTQFDLSRVGIPWLTREIARASGSRRVASRGNQMSDDQVASQLATALGGNFGLQTELQPLTVIPPMEQAQINASTPRVLEPIASPMFYRLVNAAAQFEERGRLSEQGVFVGLILTPETVYYVEYVDPVTLQMGYGSFVSGGPGLPTEIPVVAMIDQPPDDRDGDGLSDRAEIVIGTDPADDDSDDDGVLDGAEVQQGTNPLDGTLPTVGIIAAVSTPDRAEDICTRDGLAAVAMWSEGVSVFNIFEGMSPTVIAQVDTPNSATAVACADNRLLVADGAAGLAVIDISDPPAAAIAAQIEIGGAVTAVAAGDGVIGYAGGDDGTVLSVDLITNRIIASTSVPFAVEDVALSVDNRYLYALTLGEIHVIRLVDFAVETSVISIGSRGAGGRRLRLFSADELLYSVHSAGYNTFDISDPSRPVELGRGSTSQFGWKHLVDSGSGIGVAAVSVNSTDDGPHHISLYDVSDPSMTNEFLREFETPGIAAAVSVYNGLAYVADGPAGLQVINFLSADRNGVPPMVTLRTDQAGTNVVGGTVVNLGADVDDDVLVRAVSFYNDGQLLNQDSSYPFTSQYIAPTFSTAIDVVVEARATDTGGNIMWSEPVTFTVGPDTFAPIVAAVSPPDNSERTAGVLNQIKASFDERLLPASVTTDTLSVAEIGPDGLPFTDDDIPLGVADVVYRPEINLVIWTLEAELPIGRYAVSINPSISDLAGNGLTEAVRWTFSVVSTLVPGAVVEATIDSADDIDQYQFNGVAGVAYEFQVSRTAGSNLSGYARVKQGDTVLVENFFGFSSAPFYVTIPTDGVYTLEIVNSGTLTGGYLLTFENLPIAPISPDINILDDNPDDNGNYLLYSFEGQAGAYYNVGLAPEQWLFGQFTTISVLDAAGNMIAQSSRSSIHYLESGVFETESTGTYFIEITGVDAVFNFALASIDLPTPIDPADPQIEFRGDIDVLGKRHFFTYDGTTDDAHNIVINSSDGLIAQISVIGPISADTFWDSVVVETAGTSMSGQTIETQTGRFDLNVDGLHAVEISANRNGTLTGSENYLGSFWGTLLTPPPRDVAVDVSYTAVISTPFDFKRARLSGDLAPAFVPRLEGIDTGGSLRVFDDNGFLLSSVNVNVGGESEAPPVLLESGRTYFAELDLFSSFTGTLSYTLVSLAEPQMITPPANDYLHVSGAIDKPGEIDYYRFTGEAGQVVSLDIGAAAGSELDGAIYLAQDEGDFTRATTLRDSVYGLATRTFNSFGSGFQAGLTAALPVTGEYIVYVDSGRTTTAAGLGAYEFRITKIAGGQSAVVIDDDRSECPGATTVSLRAGLRALADGGTATICAGQYVEGSTIEIEPTTEVTVTGVSSQSVVIKNESNTLDTILISSGHVLIEGVTVIASANGRAIYVLNSGLDLQDSLLTEVMTDTQSANGIVGNGQLAITNSSLEFAPFGTAINFTGIGEIVNNRFNVETDATLSLAISTLADDSRVVNNVVGSQIGGGAQRGVLTFADRIEVTGNRFFNITSRALDIQAAIDFVVANNEIHLSGGAEAIGLNASYGEIYNNLITSDADVIRGLYLYNAGGDIFNNRFLLDGASQAVWHGFDTSNVYTATLYNNSFQLTNLDAAGDYGYYVQPGFGTTTVPANVVNNIFFQDTTTAVGCAVYSNLSFIREDYNVLAGFGTTYCNGVSGGTNDIELDPQFSDNDLHLSVGSPAVDAGTNSPAPADDFEGTIRPQGGGIDIGADERQ